MGATVVAGLTALAPSEAQACGGTFCEAGPTIMPVDQTGENILFIRDGATYETHIQIQYEGDPETFAWIIPVMSEPEITVGSQALFNNLLGATVPSFGNQSQVECIPDDDEPRGFGCGPYETEDLAQGGTFSSGDGGGWDETGGGDDGGPDILQQGVAGAFEYVVLTGSNIDEVVTWLDDNDFQQDEEAPPILEDYLDKGYVFVAVKLQSGAGVEEIQPLVVRYTGNTYCFPLTLTRIAAVDDMRIRAFFASEERVVPTNFSLVEPNWAGLAWNSPGDNYDELITMAVDEAPMGHGWVTEYADAMDIVPTVGLLGPTWSSHAFSDAAITDVVDILESQNLMSCSSSSGCEFWHPMVEPLLNKHLPVPEGVTSDAFYSCLECHESLLDVDGWVAQDFADDFAERIVEPGKRAEAIVEDFPFLTRLYTTISPHEMTVDPIFHENGDLGVYEPPTFAINHLECESPDWWTLPTGLRVHNDDDNNYPSSIPNMPAAATIWSVPSMGAAQATQDNAEAIADAIKDWNKAHPLHGEGSDCAVNRRARNQGLVSLACLLVLMGVRRRRRE